MDGANYGYPFYNGLATSISGAVGSDGCSWGGGGDDNSADNVFEQLLASLVASGREATFQVPIQQQHPYQESSDDISNIQFRHQLQARGSTSSSSTNAAQKKKKIATNPTVAGLLGIEENKKTSEKRKKQGDASANKKRKTKDEDYEASYQQLFHEEVVPKLRTLSDLKADTIVKTNKLHKQHRLALLFVKFGIFHRDNNSISANDVKKLLRAEL